MNLLNILLKAFLSKSALKSLSKKTGIDSKTISNLLLIAVPFLLKMLTGNAASKDGKASLLEALTQHTEEKPMDQMISEADTLDGEKIIGHILGSRKDEELKALSKEAKMSEPDVSGVLSSIAPALLTTLSSATKSGKKAKKAKVDLSDGLDLSDVVAMLGGATPEAEDILGLLGGAKSKKEKDNSSNGLSLLSSLLS